MMAVVGVIGPSPHDVSKQDPGIPDPIEIFLALSTIIHHLGIKVLDTIAGRKIEKDSPKGMGKSPMACIQGYCKHQRIPLHGDLLEWCCGTTPNNARQSAIVMNS
jgi:hypothetical protein